MAGGRGERFWPRSRAAMPKQFLHLCGTGTLLQETFRRARRIVPAGDIYVITPRRYRDLTLHQLPDLRPENLILEPFGCDTAPSVGLATALLRRRDPEGTMIVLPADHLITDEDRFASTLSAAAAVAARGEHLVTIGLRPTRPETGYGYIQRGAPLDLSHIRIPRDSLSGESGPRAYSVRRFAEKPALEQAQAFLASGDYLWNGGMFAWRTATVRQLIAEHLPWLDKGLDAIASSLSTPGEEGVIEREFQSFRRISIDYGLLERVDNVVVIPGDFGWDDVGNWAALERIYPLDEHGNVTDGRVVAINTDGCILSCRDRLMVAHGVEGLLIVDAGDVILVADRTRGADLKQLLAELRRRGLEAYLEDVTDHQGGGYYGNGSPAALAAAGPAEGGVARDEAVAPRSPVSDHKGKGYTEAPQVCFVPLGEDSSAAGVRVVDKPWGREIWWAVTDRYAGKIIQVRAGNSLSLQFHEVKLETMLFTRGRGVLMMEQRLVPIREGLCVTIPPGVVHRVVAEEDVEFYEVSTPEFDDVVRLADAYGRSGAT